MTPTGHPAPAWFDISSPDAPRARRFYQEMFGWPVNVLDETYALVGDDSGQPTGGIGQAVPTALTPGSSSISRLTTSIPRSRGPGNSVAAEGWTRSACPGGGGWPCSPIPTVTPSAC